MNLRELMARLPYRVRLDRDIAWFDGDGGHDHIMSCPSGEWLLALASGLWYTSPEISAAIMPSVLRAARVHVPDLLRRSGMREQAHWLRSLRDDCTPATLRLLLSAVRRQSAGDANAALGYLLDALHHAETGSAAWAMSRLGLVVSVSARGAGQGYGPVRDEQMRCADDVRRVLTGIAERVQAVRDWVASGGVKP